MSLESWEALWLAHRDEWEGEVWNVPGVMSALCEMDCIDMIGAEKYLEWRNR